MRDNLRGFTVANTPIIYPQSGGNRRMLLVITELFIAWKIGLSWVEFDFVICLGDAPDCMFVIRLGNCA